MTVFVLAIIVGIFYPISIVLDDSFTGNSPLISKYNEFKKDSNRDALSHQEISCDYFNRTFTI